MMAPWEEEKTSSYTHQAAQALSIATRGYWDYLVNYRRTQAMDRGCGQFPVCREVHIAVRLDLLEFLDDLAMQSGWRAERLSEVSLILEPPGALIVCNGFRKRHYCSCWLQVWAASPARLLAIRAEISTLAGAALITEPMFTLEWHFLKNKVELEVVTMEERADDVLLDEAYPQLEGGVGPFIANYLDSDAAVLVLHGPPGTGKTRLIRGILGAMSRRTETQARVMYTGDARALESDEIFTRFIVGDADAFVVEDADHLLLPRVDGNDHLHRFLTIADGVARANGRKIIFSSNLPNIGDLDDALIRPGRCFARVQMRNLTSDEGTRLVDRLVEGDYYPSDFETRRFDLADRREISLADVYQVVAG